MLCFASPMRTGATFFMHLAACLSFLGCRQEAAARPRQREQTAGSLRLIETLRAVAARGREYPSSNSFLNLERATELQSLIVGRQGDDQLKLRTQLAEELLRAGKVREAIGGLETILLESGMSWDHIKPANKSTFDLLAIAYLRLGEVENCTTDAAANICILPLKGGARHKKQEGARGAIERYTKLLQQFPDDRGSQWLLNLAHLQIGNYPDSVPPALLVPNIGLGASDAFPEFPNIAHNVGLDVFGHAGGVVIEDLNGDGLLDVMTSSWGFDDPMHVFLADGHGGYTDRTADAGLEGITGGLNITHADFDNDGDDDVLVLRGAWLGDAGQFPFSLLRNDGAGHFEDVTVDAGLFSLGGTNSAAWADYDLDGNLDLFVAYESYAKLKGTPPLRSKLFHNNGNGTFTEVSADAGLNFDAFAKGATWGDVNNDGLPDLYVSVLFDKNRLYMNRGAGPDGKWRFEERTAAAGVEKPIASFSTWFFDFDNDGFEDLFVPAYDVNAAMHEMVAREFLGLPLQVTMNGQQLGVEMSKLYHNRGDGTFEDVSKRVGLDGKVIYGMGSNFGGLDNDGWLDFYIGTGNPDLRTAIPNRMFHSVGGARFEEVTAPGGFGHIQKGHGTAFADLDRDGNQDVFIEIGGAYEGDNSSSVLFGNPGRWPGNAWITLKLQGRSANRSAIGARLELIVADSAGRMRSIHRTVGTGGSFGAGPLEMHVGLGAATTVKEVRVRWPDKALSRAAFTNLAANRYYEIVQGGQPTVLNRPPVPFRTTPSGSGPSMNMPMPK
ncbi:MAG: CRTAC1 family protein [Gemmatimonadaceae bacterium]|nr:CRTAC1 family protein [Gemmatimonadaceae bacterium]